MQYVYKQVHWVRESHETRIDTYRREATQMQHLCLGKHFTEAGIS